MLGEDLADVFAGLPLISLGQHPLLCPTRAVAPSEIAAPPALSDTGWPTAGPAQCLETVMTDLVSPTGQFFCDFRLDQCVIKTWHPFFSRYKYFYIYIGRSLEIHQVMATLFSTTLEKYYYEICSTSHYCI